MQTETYILPESWACALINNDYSGLSKDDKEAINNFLESQDSDYRFACLSCSDEPYFKWSNDATEQGGNVLEYIFDVTPHRPEGLTNADIYPFDTPPADSPSLDMPTYTD